MGPSTAPPDRSCWKNAEPWAAAKPARPNSPEATTCPANTSSIPSAPSGRAGSTENGRCWPPCYQNALALAKAHGCESIAFPLISSNAYGYPKAQAMQVAVEAVAGFLLENDMDVYIVVFTRDTVEMSEKLFSAVVSYIDDVYVDAHYDAAQELRRKACWQEAARSRANETTAVPVNASLEDMLEQIDESFAETLLRKIDERRMTDAECYKRANIDRRLFNKIKNNPAYRPGKQTALAFAIALRLSLAETKDLLMKAGYALSHSNKTDIVVEYCISTGNYDIHEINQVLFRLDLQPLGY